jgi:transcriptional regulator with XRE-family HTH domain
MRGIGQDMTIGQRVAWYRRRRGMSQEVLAGLVDRTVDWLSKVENNHIDLDRLSVIRSLAQALDVTLGDLLGEPSILEWTFDSGTRTVPALRNALLDYRQLSPALAVPADEDPTALPVLSQAVAAVWDAYQNSRYGFVVHQLPKVVHDTQIAAHSYEGDQRDEAHGHLALTYQAAAVLLTKLGEAELAWVAAERGFQAAQESGDPVVVGSLFRSVAHALLSTGRYREAKGLTVDAAAYLEPHMASPSPEMLSVYGTLFLAGAVAAARDEDRSATQEFLANADQSARRLGRDANHMWTAFGPTNVAIHRVATAMDLGDVQVAIELGPRVDTSGMPIERRVRHAMETARAYTAWNRTDDAMAILMDAERVAPEQVRHHAMSRQLVQTWVHRSRGKPSFQLASLAQRVHASN